MSNTTTAPAAPPQATTTATATAPTAQPPPLDLTTLDLTAEERSQARELLLSAWSALDDETRRKVTRRAARLAESGSCASPSARTIATKYLILSQVMRPRAAARELSIKLDREFGAIHATILADPAFCIMYNRAREISHARIVAKGEDVAERALDGEDVSRSQERLASLALERLDRATWAPDRNGGDAGRATAPTAAAQVVINLGGDKDLNICSNLLQGSRGGVING